MAPLGVPTGDRRKLAAGGRWRLNLSAALLRPGTADAIGAVTRAVIEDGWLIASGTVAHAPTAELMATGQVHPELFLADTTHHRTPDGVLCFDSGVIRSITAGRNPAWSDTRFILED